VLFLRKVAAKKREKKRESKSCFLKFVSIKQRFHTRYLLDRPNFWSEGSQHLGLPFHHLDRRNKFEAKRNLSCTEAVLLGIFNIFVLFCKICFFVVLATCCHYLCITF